jgi:hypothetical protein
MADEARAKQYMDEAEKKLKSSGSIFSSIFRYMTNLIKRKDV